MQQRDLKKGMDGPITGRTEVMVAISGLVDEVARLALQVKRIAAKAGVAEAGHATDVRQVSATCATEAIDHTEIEVASAVTACDAHEIEMVEAANSPLLPEDSWISNASTSEISPLPESNAGRDGLANVEAVLAEPTDANCRAENPIAANILKLSDRLGGLLKSLPSRSLDQDT